jgi:Clostripain family
VKKIWTVAVYMAGDNNLDNNGKLDLAEMKKVGSTADINVVAQFDSLSAGSKTTRYEISKGPIAKLAKDAKQKLGTQNTGDPQSLIGFIDWVATNYPAEHYLLVLWNHGQGWDDTDIFADSRSASSRLPRTDALRHALFRTSVMKAEKGSRQEIMRAILIDDNSKDFLDNIEMKKVLQAAKTKLGQKLDIFGMDACLMNQAEVIYQVRANTLFAVGSELTEPLDGWPYTDILSKLAKNPSTTPAELAKVIVSD